MPSRSTLSTPSTASHLVPHSPSTAQFAVRVCTQPLPCPRAPRPSQWRPGSCPRPAPETRPAGPAGTRPRQRAAPPLEHRTARVAHPPARTACARPSQTARRTPAGVCELSPASPLAPTAAAAPRARTGNAAPAPRCPAGQCRSRRCARCRQSAPSTGCVRAARRSARREPLHGRRVLRLAPAAARAVAADGGDGERRGEEHCVADDLAAALEVAAEKVLAIGRGGRRVRVCI